MELFIIEPLCVHVQVKEAAALGCFLNRQCADAAITLPHTDMMACSSYPFTSHSYHSLTHSLTHS
jgi:hypothetical protein